MLILTVISFVSVALFPMQAECFGLNLPPATHFSSTVLFPHSFTGYDPGVSGVISWSPSEAAEFIVWHHGEPKQAGMQLSPMIKNWSGDDVGEFLSRLFLGKVIKEENKVSFCPSNVRNPQWLGLGDKGFIAMEELLFHALPDSVLTPEALSRCAQEFLTKEHRWPAKIDGCKEDDRSKDKDKDKEIDRKNKDGGVQFESDTFASLGYSAQFARVLGSVRRERISEFTADDIVKMLTLPEHGDKAHGYAHMPDFFNNLGVKLTASQKVATVERLALSGWAPSTLAKFVCSIGEIEEGQNELDTDAVVPVVEKNEKSTATSGADCKPVLKSKKGSYVPAGFIPIKTRSVFKVPS